MDKAATPPQQAAHLYRGMDRDALDAAYNNARAFPDSADFLSRWDAESAAARQRIAACAGFRVETDIRYAAAERARLDMFLRAEAGCPTLIFLHGGYWHLNAKERFSFVAHGPLTAGLNVVIPSYPLAPAASMDEIVAAARDAVRWVVANIGAHGGDPQRIGLAGWSAGGHLAACAMGERGIRYGLAISGLYDLEPVRLSYLNEILALSSDEARRNSPLWHLPDRAGHLTIGLGADELPEFRRQGRAYHAAWRDAGLGGAHRVVPGRHHFAVLEELARPDGAFVDTLARWTW